MPQIDMHHQPDIPEERLAIKRQALQLRVAVPDKRWQVRHAYPCANGGMLGGDIADLADYPAFSYRCQQPFLIGHVGELCIETDEFPARWLVQIRVVPVGIQGEWHA